MLAFFGNARREKIKDRAYGDLLDSPCQRFLTEFLEQTFKRRGTAICSGYMGKTELLASVDECPPNDASIMFGEIRGPGNRSVIPMWAEIAGNLEPVRFVPLTLYVGLLAALGDRLVSIAGTPENHQPKAYVEISSSGSQRRFLEVQYEWDIHDAFWIRILGERTPLAGEKVSLGFC